MRRTRSHRLRREPSVADTGRQRARPAHHENFDALGGTETYIVAVAAVLHGSATRPTVYIAARGVAAGGRAGTGRAGGRPQQLPRGCDLVLANDLATAAEMAATSATRYACFVAHSAPFRSRTPPAMAGIADRIVVLNDRLSMRSAPGPGPRRRSALRQPIDCGASGIWAQCARRLRIALVNSRYIDGGRATMLREAADDAGLELQWLGPASDAGAPEVQIAGADVVIGLGRSALEAWRPGRPTLVYGVGGRRRLGDPRDAIRRWSPTASPVWPGPR